MKIAIIGYGTMGKTIETLALEGGHEVLVKIGRNNLHDFRKETLQQVDVAIEFSNPDSAFSNLSSCIEWGIPVVSGTTGWLDQYDRLKDLCEQKKGAFLYASNFSIGVNIFFAINRQLADMMNVHQQYNVGMEEIHHTQKLDAPSGTAISLAQDILSKVDRKTSWINKPQEASTDLSIISKRIENVPGTHHIVYESAIDTIEIKHTAHSRKGFAAGALLAAEWIIGKQGSFSMKDLLGF